ncbi:cytochrome P450 [Aspergillus heteromorphus CBS 117.55]|uniref:Cytochrome P450 n=1 Tax=Aspergillus heteromorphus CBS 117.55 TaxID=1448321 RepID=A0A317UXF5_9EURO|nr:cytochrome P450 [Aspergillus heteromorphus CBS 117.55]PWY66009.1 cytochrome P450 [Aspergillus heteromorphus CBS 117.55]
MHASLAKLTATGTLVGVVVSYVARQGEIEQHLVRLLGLFGGSNLILVAYAVISGTGCVSHALAQVLLINVAFFTGLFGNIVLYRLFFHRLRHVPGPLGPRISRLYTAFSQLTHTQMHYTVQEMHQQYGDVVRTGPREISICRPSAIKAIYGPPTRCTKSPWYDQMTYDTARKGFIAIRDIKAHGQRRRVWDQGIRTQAIKQYQERIAAKSRLFVRKIGEQKGQPVNFTKEVIRFAFDVMGDIVLGTEFGMLETGRIPDALQQMHKSTKALAVGGSIPWMPALMLQIPGMSKIANPFRHYCHEQLAAVQEVCPAVRGPWCHGSRSNVSQAQTQSEEPTDMISWVIRAQNNGDPGAPSPDGLKDDAWVLIIAGSDTTSTVLTNTLFYLATHPDVQTNLQSRLDEVFPAGMGSWSYEPARDMDYLTWIINETLRLKPAVPGGLSRVTPPEGLQIDELRIPGDVVVSVPTFTIHRDGRFWEKGDRFVPDRWEKIDTNQAPYLPFSRGVLSQPSLGCRRR